MAKWVVLADVCGRLDMNWGQGVVIIFLLSMMTVLVGFIFYKVDHIEKALSASARSQIDNVKP